MLRRAHCYVDFRRRARSGDSARIRALCLITDSRTFEGNFAFFLRFLSQNRAPLHLDKLAFIPENHIEPSDDIGLPLFILTTISANIQPKPVAVFNVHTRSRAITLSMQRSWPKIYDWVSFFVQFFVEQNLQAYDELQDDTGLRVLRMALYIFAGLFDQEIIQLEYALSIPGAGELILRIHIYALTPSLEATQAAALIMDGYFKAENVDFSQLYTTTFEQLSQSNLPALIMQTLIDLRLPKEVNFSILHLYLRALAMQSPTPSRLLNSCSTDTRYITSQDLWSLRVMLSPIDIVVETSI
ncbi:hypothetical protein GYMLUDRAFT_1012324 [Collybiopsis luxurians FD-317 M1]|uniref:Uncharacterized protein n=1 Tax=Collybiopsis luxurians FD-317 M1 TaxID=944289 RepID=A0A0D0BPA6_9AGAR|nr:hypothetical protein GYMLUDRAFT_1012324 [Collybiopsis luxurians FD-317 M1]